MSRKILLVEGEHGVPEDIVRELRTQYEVCVAKSAEEGYELLRSSGPFPMVIAETASGLGFLRQMSSAPNARGAWGASHGSANSVALAAITDDHVFRFLDNPITASALLQAVDEVFDRAVDVDATEREANRLVESLTDQLRGVTPASQLAEPVALLACLQRLAQGLTGARSISDIARLTAEAAHAALGGGGVHVQLWDGANSSVVAGADAGPEMSSRIHLVPIEGRTGQIGEIAVDAQRASRGPLTTPEKALLAALAGTAAVAAYNEFRRRSSERTHHATLVALARLAGQRDNETAKHLKRIEAYCRLMAEALRGHPAHAHTVDDEFIDDLVRASALHDIGEVGVPDAILMKSGKLKPEEWEIMKTHAEIGALTLDSVIQEFGEQSFLAMGRDLAWCHHEKWDGTGYPRGLKGADVPLAARIMALADVYDALTTVRPYKTAWEHTDAVEWIESQSGLHFDPDVVAAFVARQASADKIRVELADTLEELQSKNPAIFGEPSRS